MKSEWKQVTLNDVTDILGDGIHGTPEYSQSGEYAFINGNNLVNGQIQIKDSTKRVGLEQFIKHKKPLSNRTILVSINGTLGNVATYRGEKVILGKSACYLNVSENVSKDFIQFKVMAPDFQSYLQNQATGTTIKNVSLKQMREYTFLLPPLDVQKSIAAILLALNDKIELNQKINDNLQQQAFTLFDRFLSVEHSSKCPLSQIAIINPKRILKKGKYARYIDMAQLSTSGSFPNGWEIKPYNGGMRFSNGDTLLARITPCLENGKTAYIDFLDENEVAFGSTEYVVISSRGEYPPEFFYCLARCPSFVDYAVKNMNGSSGRQRVSAETVGNYLLPALTEDELQEFRSTVPCLFKMIRNNAIESMVLTQLRDSLLPRLISGEIDVSNIKC